MQQLPRAYHNSATKKRVPALPKTRIPLKLLKRKKVPFSTTHSSILHQLSTRHYLVPHRLLHICMGLVQEKSEIWGLPQKSLNLFHLFRTCINSVHKRYNTQLLVNHSSLQEYLTNFYTTCQLHKIRLSPPFCCEMKRNPNILSNVALSWKVHSSVF